MAWPINLMCNILNVTSNGYYSFMRRSLNKRVEPLHEEMLEWVQDIAKASGDTYGSRRMKEAGTLAAQPGAGVIHHSDRGSQYASKEMRRSMKKSGIKGA